MESHKIELVDVEVSPGKTEKRVKLTQKLDDHIEYASKEQLDALKIELTNKIEKVNDSLALFQK